MKNKICVANDFITFTGNHIAKIQAAADKAGFPIEFFADEESAKGHVADGEILYTTTPELAQEMPDLKWVACSFAGVEKYCVPGVLPDHVLLTNSAGAYGTTISEHIITVALMLLRRMPEYMKHVEKREWFQDYDIRSIFGSRVTIMGTGDIGSNTAQRMKAMGAAKVTGVSRSGRMTERMEGNFDDVIASSGEGSANALLELLSETDILVMCMPSTPETKGMLSAERIAALPSHAIIINVGRGAAIDQDALVEALNSGKIAGAAPDVFVQEPIPQDDPIWDAKNILITPHIAGNMALGYTQDCAVELFCRDIDNYANGRPLENLVDRKRGY